MILTDTGPLIALLDKRDNHHKRCLDAIKMLPAEPMLTTWPCFIEAMHILGSVGGIVIRLFFGSWYRKRNWNSMI